MVKKVDKDVNGGRLTITPPAYLGQQAKVIWRKVVPFLETQSSVNRIDSGLVEMYCTQYEIYRNAYKHVRENGEVQAIYKPVQDFEGTVIDKTFQGYKRNPMTNIYSDSLKNLAKIGSELGLSPKSRSELMELSGNDNSDESSTSQMKEFFADEED
ncbi:phage terminase small subunit P27 family [Leuconostoc mesenteroides]|uniref:phage terminase small subunit P27 family n=1 Tax=Leuconostoc mesenteroides TaxID=1245 RepID=UPI000FFCDAE0|nr:phage terminase small subunit P27 family [Leuconostoc mesenteroides]MBS0941605.1 phage terminase small subunit P27 family [Leuconostoc mesenteroides]QAR69380.1 phage terminase small subunit P27 family [Leuconostoc mesenteroides]QBC40188.1 phage terminase small subunit P27 family [Leuconostoc mesenteroides]TGD33801.1 phage terminase small subunit P27 family [Leuconostoc mesenteroides]WJM73892.1 phage terminase small subunit P27 family [Leuconostoc mesenteroides]